MQAQLRDVAPPFILGVALVGAFIAFDGTQVTASTYERRTPTLDEMITLERSQSDPRLDLPDLVPLPARDLTLQSAPDGHLTLLFSTTYFNQGDGPLELRADQATAGLTDDLDRVVYQHVYGEGGASSDIPVGTFGWHQSHRHYHFADFVSYVLTQEDGADTRPIVLEKATFCIRDVSRLVHQPETAKPRATYTVCGKERQGVSVGWGDTYYFNYPDQSIDLSDIPSGTYRLTFIVNPGHRLQEQSYLNDKSFTVFELDKERRAVRVIHEYPEHAPDVEHIHLDDPFGM